MGLFLAGQAPDKIRSGSSLIKSSTPGTRIDFLQQSTFGTGSITLTTGLVGAFRFNLTIYPPDLPTASQVSGLQIPQLSSLGFPMFDFFTDTNNDYNYEFSYGSSLTTEQKNMTIGGWFPYGPLSGTSYANIMIVKNHGANTHTVYTNGLWKYLISGEETT
jgi:hypothetical protein